MNPILLYDLFVVIVTTGTVVVFELSIFTIKLLIESEIRSANCCTVVLFGGGVVQPFATIPS